MYKPTPVEMYSYEDYKDYLSGIIKKIEEDNKRDKKEVRDHLLEYKNDRSNVYSVSDDGIYWRRIIDRDPEHFIEAVGISYRIFLRKQQLQEIMNELTYLTTDKGKQDYIEKKGKYSNTVLLWKSTIRLDLVDIDAS